MEILTRKKIIGIGLTVVLLIGLVVGVVLVQRQQILKSRASLQAYNAFNVASGEAGKYVNCSGNVCETNTLNITISVRDLQALNIQEQQVAGGQQCVWQPAPLRCTGCGVASILEQDSCNGEIRAIADDVTSEECNLSEWCGSYVTQNTTERPPEQLPEPQGGQEQTCEEKSYCDDNLGLRVFWNTCQSTPVKEAEFDQECVPAEQVALNLKLREEQEQTQTQDLVKQLEQEEQARIEAKKAETANIPQNVANFVGGLPGGVWGGISSLWESQQQKPPEKSLVEKIQDNGMILLKLVQSFAEQGRREQEIYNQKVTPQCQAYLQSSYASGGVVFYQGDNPCAYLEGQKIKTAEEAAVEAEKAALESNDLKVGLANLQVNMDISEGKRNFTFCLSPIFCPSIEVGVPADAKVTFADLMRKNQVVELAEKLDLDLTVTPKEWDQAKREYFFKVIARGDINPAKALAEFLVPVTSLENLQVSKSICEKKYQGNCIVSSDNILGIINMSDQDIEQANQIALQLYPQLNPASREKVREYAKILYSDSTINDQYLSDVAKAKYDREIAQSLGVSPGELVNIKNTFKVYGQVGDHIRNNTSEGKLFQQDQNQLALEGSIAVVTSLPAADLAMEGLVLGIRKVTPKVLSILIRDYGDDVAKKIAKDVESVAERGSRSMSAAEAASIRKAEAALAKSSGDDLALAATPAESLDNLIRGGGLDNDAAAAVRTIRDDPNLDQTAAQGLKNAHSGANSLDDAMVVIPDSDARFIAPDRQLAGVADNLDGAEARLLGEAPLPPNPAADMWNQATGGLKSWVDDLAGVPCPVGVGLIPIAYAQSGGSPCIKAGLDRAVSLERNLAAGQKTPELEEFWRSLVRDADGRFKKYQDEQDASYYKGPQPSFSLADQDAVRYVRHSLDTRKAFLEGMEHGQIDLSQRDFQNWLVNLHQKQTYKQAQKLGELFEGGMTSRGAHTPFVKNDVVAIAEKYQDPYADFYKNPQIYGNTYNLDLPGISPKGRPQDGLVGDLVYHQYPNSMFRDEYTSVMQQKLRELGRLGQEAPLEQQLRLISEFYQYAINDRMFTKVNQSLYMNMVNGLLEQRGLRPIEHGVLDFVAMRLQPDNFARYFSDEVRRVQPGQVLQARPVNQAVSPVQAVARGIQGALDRVGVGAAKKEIFQAQSFDELDKILDQTGVLQGSGNRLYSPEQNEKIIMGLREGKIKFSDGTDPLSAVTSAGDLRATVNRLLKAREIKDAETPDELIAIVRQKGRVGNYSSEDMIRGLEAIRDGKTGRADPYEVVTRTDGLRDKARELGSCPIRIGLIPVALAQEGGGLNPCPGNPLAALARNAGNAFERVKDNVGGWVDNFKEIFRKERKKEVVVPKVTVEPGDVVAARLTNVETRSLKVGDRELVVRVGYDPKYKETSTQGLTYLIEPGQTLPPNVKIINKTGQVVDLTQAKKPIGFAEIDKIVVDEKEYWPVKDAWLNPNLLPILEAKLPNPQFVPVLKQVLEVWDTAINDPSRIEHCLQNCLALPVYQKVKRVVDYIENNPDLSKLSVQVNPWELASMTSSERERIYKGLGGFQETPLFAKLEELVERIKTGQLLSDDERVLAEALEFAHIVNKPRINEAGGLNRITEINRQYSMANLAQDFLIRDLMPKGVVQVHQTNFREFQDLLKRNGVELPDWFTSFAESEFRYGIQLDGTLANSGGEIFLGPKIWNAEEMADVLTHERVHGLEFTAIKLTGVYPEPEGFRSNEVFTDALARLITHNGNAEAALADKSLYETGYFSGVYELLKIVTEINNYSTDSFQGTNLLVHGILGQKSGRIRNLAPIEEYYDRFIAGNGETFAQRMVAYDDRKLIVFWSIPKPLEEKSYPAIEQIARSLSSAGQIREFDVQFYIENPMILLSSSGTEDSAGGKIFQGVVSDEKARQEMQEIVDEYYRNYAKALQTKLDEVVEKAVPPVSIPPEAPKTILEQVGGTLQNWFNAIFNTGKKQSLSLGTVVV